MTYDDPVVTYDGTPTDAFFAQLMAQLQANPENTVAALKAETIPVDVQKMNGAEEPSESTFYDSLGGK
jgi:hypothetical protein